MYPDIDQYNNHSHLETERPPVTPTTAIIRVNPMTDELVKSLQQQAISLKASAQSFLILCDDDLNMAGNDLAIMAGVKMRIKAKLEEYTRPIKTHLDSIVADFKLFSVPLEEADHILRDKVAVYRKQQSDNAIAARHINDLRMQAAQEEARLHAGEIKESVILVPEPPAPAKTIHTDLGTIGTREDQDFEVIDQALVPEDYKLIDRAKVLKVLRANVTIPGIRGFKRAGISVRPNKV